MARTHHKGLGRKVEMVSAKQHLVKRKGHVEEYDQKKVYASVYAASLNCHHSGQDAERLALAVMKKVGRLVERKDHLTSDDIRDAVLASIPDKEVALMYRHHLDVC